MNIRKMLTKFKLERTYRLLRKINMKYKKTIYNILYKKFKVKSNRVIFDSFLGKGYSCNPRYIYEYMNTTTGYKKYKCIWVLRNPKKEEIPNAKVVKYGTIKHFYYLVTSEFWVFNSKIPKYFKKKKEQIYLQTWHGTPLKRLAKDIDIGEDATFYRSKMSYEEMVKTYEQDEEKYDFLVSPNEYSTEKFQSAFGVNKRKILETGYPRNDSLFTINEVEVNEIKDKLNIPKKKKVILYAPTWRENKYSARGYTYTPKVDFKKWKESLGEEFVVIYKPHYLIVNKIEDNGLENFLYRFDSNIDIKDLYLISNILITDYSSVFFDYICLDKPVVFYMDDLKEYKEELRGFYININELPGPIVEEENELLKEIKNQFKETNTDKIKEFKKKLNYFDDGRASERVVKAIFNS
ncbi:MAG: CDP-glycerol glycerophosphotransferase family protein [Clostridium sp.]